jgi:hypothetical protein
MQEEAAATEAAQHAEEVQSALAALQRQSEEEDRIEKRLSQLQKEEAVLVANREQRMAQYRERREQDHSDAIKREEELSRALKVAFCAVYDRLNTLLCFLASLQRVTSCRLRSHYASCSHTKAS